MLINYLRNKIYKKFLFARQSWDTKNKYFKSYKFNHLNFTFREYGNKNPKKKFYVIRRHPGAGFFSNLCFVIHHLLICDDLKMIPIIDMENYQTFYNCKKKIRGTYNSWEYFFKPVSNYTLNEVYQSKNVIISDNRTSKGGFSKSNYNSEFKYLNGFQYFGKKHKKISDKYIKIHQDIKDKAAEIYKQFRNKKVMGVCFRGSDQKRSAYQPHNPTEKQIKHITDELIKKYKFDKIYLCTEDEDYLKFYKKNYGDMLIYSDSYRTTDKKDLFDNNKPDHRYKIGKGNLVDMLVLSKTNYLLFSTSNIPYTAIFFSNKKIPCALIDNGMKGNIFVSQFSWFIRKSLPFFLGGFKNEYTEFNKK